MVFRRFIAAEGGKTEKTPLKFGMPTLVECEGLAACAQVAAREGLDFIELNMSFPQYQPSRLAASECRKVGEEYGLFYTIHADEALNPFDFHPAVAACYNEVFRETLEFALAIGAPLVNLHLPRGVYVTLPDRRVFLNEIYADEVLSRVAAFRDLCDGVIGSAPLRVLVENVDTGCFTDSQRSILASLFESPRFGLTLDIGHADCLGYRDDAVFAAYPDRLRHLHLHDSNGKSAHLPLGEGRVDIPYALSRLPKDGTCLVEVKTVDGLKTSVSYLKERNLWRSL